MFGEDGKHVTKYLIKPVEFNEILRQKVKKVLGMGGKPLGKQGFAEGEAHHRKIMKIVGKDFVCEDGKHVAKYLIKPEESHAILREHAERVCKIIETHWGNNVLRRGKRTSGKP